MLEHQGLFLYGKYSCGRFYFVDLLPIVRYTPVGLFDVPMQWD